VPCVLLNLRGKHLGTVAADICFCSIKSVLRQPIYDVLSTRSASFCSLTGKQQLILELTSGRWEEGSDLTFCQMISLGAGAEAVCQALTSGC
jgi:hypothetical protein